MQIRIKELYDVVDYFLILESNSTFTGLKKELIFAQNRERFNFAVDKIKYKAIMLPPLNGRDPFVLERIQRSEMDSLINSMGLEKNDRIVMADVDEIPSGHTLSLLKHCTAPNVHLQLRNYMYSFEFFIDFNSWRSKVVRYPYPYSHSRTPAKLLADAGWHCSYCFRSLADFQFKMKAYSHADRVHSKLVLDPKRIQSVICDGTDIFDLVPEAYTYKELWMKWMPTKSASGVGLPWWALKEAIRFKYLLPGGCLRDV